MIRFTIITICLNMEKEIGETIASVLHQTCTNFEYIIKDGVSKDGTVGVAQSFAASFAEKGIPYRILVKPDTGIYDAMNQATREAQGEWVLYMNAGDMFANQGVLSMVEESGILETSDIVYGDRIGKNEDWYIYKSARPLELLRVKMPFCHQSAFARRQLLQQTPFSTAFRLCGDYLFFFQQYQKGKRFAYLPAAFSIVDKTGVSMNAEAVTRDLLAIHEQMPERDEVVIREFRHQLRRMKNREPLSRLVQRLTSARLKELKKAYLRKNSGWKKEAEFFAELSQRNGKHEA